MIIKECNDLVRQKHDLIREDNPFNERKIEELEIQIRKKTSEYLDAVQTKKQTIINKMEDLSDLPSYRQQYQMAIQLYREAVELVEQMREIKKQMREEKKNGKRKV
jgi:hypothetical protein